MPLYPFINKTKPAETDYTIQRTKTEAGNTILLDAKGVNSSTLSNNLVAYWKMDNNWNDSKGTNHGTAYGATFSTGSKLGSHAGSFDGIDDYIDCGNASTFNISACSLHFWFNTSNTAQLGKHIFSKGNAEPWTIQFKTEGDQIRFWVKNTASQYQYTQFATSLLVADTWHQIIGTWDGVNIKLFLDGILRGITAFTGTLAITTNNVNIARESGGAGYYGGLLDEVAPWGRAVTDGGVTTVGQTAGGEVAELWNNGAGVEIGSSFRTKVKIKNSGTTNVDLETDGDIYGGSGNTKIKLTPSVADRATAIAHTLDTENALSTAGAKLVSIKNNGTEKFGLDKDGIPIISQNSTGAGTPLLGTNCPATTLTAPYTWIKMTSSDGSTVYIPAWK